MEHLLDDFEDDVPPMPKKPAAAATSKKSAKPKKSKPMLSDDEGAAGSESGSDSVGSHGRAQSTFGDMDDQNLSEDEEDRKMREKRQELLAKQRAAEKAKAKAKPKVPAAKEADSEEAKPKKAKAPEAPEAKKPKVPAPKPKPGSSSTTSSSAKPAPKKPTSKPAPKPADEEDQSLDSSPAVAKKPAQKRKREEPDSSQEQSRSETEKKVPAKKGKTNAGDAVAKPKRPSGQTKEKEAQEAPTNKSKSSGSSSSSTKKTKKTSDDAKGKKSGSKKAAKDESASESLEQKKKPKKKPAQAEREDEPVATETPAAPLTNKEKAQKAAEDFQHVCEHMVKHAKEFVLTRYMHGMPIHFPAPPSTEKGKSKADSEPALGPRFDLHNALSDRTKGQGRVSVEAAKFFIDDARRAGKLQTLVLDTKNGRVRAPDLPPNNDVRRIATLVKHGMLEEAPSDAKERNAWIKARDTTDNAVLSVVTRYVAMGQNVLLVTGGHMGYHMTEYQKAHYYPGTEVLFGGPDATKNRIMSEAELEAPVYFMYETIRTAVRTVSKQTKNFAGLSNDFKRWQAVRDYMSKEWEFSANLTLHLVMLWKDMSASGEKKPSPMEGLLENVKDGPHYVWTKYKYAYLWSPQDKAYFKECEQKMKQWEARKKKNARKIQAAVEEADDDEVQEEEVLQEAEASGDEAEAEPEPEAAPTEEGQVDDHEADQANEQEAQEEPVGNEQEVQEGPVGNEEEVQEGPVGNDHEAEEAQPMQVDEPSVPEAQVQESETIEPSSLGIEKPEAVGEDFMNGVSQTLM